MVQVLHILHGGLFLLLPEFKRLKKNSIEQKSRKFFSVMGSILGSKKSDMLTSHPGSIFHGQDSIGNNPPETKGRDDAVGNTVEKGRALIGAEIIKRKNEGKSN